MDKKDYYTDLRRLAYLGIMLKRHKASKYYPTDQQTVREQLRHAREIKLGTNVSLLPLINKQEMTTAASDYQGVPDITGVEMLADIMLPDLLEARSPSYAYERDEVEVFLHTALTYLATGVNSWECIFDTIIRLAELHEKDPEILQIIYLNELKTLRDKDDWYKYAFDAFDEYDQWLRDHERCSTVSFSEELGYGIACFLGQLRPRRNA